MKNFKRILALVLTLVMVLPMLVACGDKQGTQGGDGSGSELTKTKSIVPDDVKFEGETFTILCREDNAWGEWLHEIAADEDATELVNEAVYQRNLEVEERFGLEKLEAYDIAGQWNVKDDFVNTFRNSILSNSGSFDLIMSQQAYMADPGLNDLYLNFYDVPYIKDNLSAEYYFQDVINELTVNGQLKFLVGDYSLTYWEFLYVMYFNKKIAQNNNLEDLYQLVKDGNWTIDKCIEMSKGIFSDMNGDSSPDEGDLFGYVSEIPNATDALFSTFDVQPTSKDENGNVVISIDQGKMVNVLEKIVEFKKTDDCYMVQTSSAMTVDENPCDKIFQEDRALFYPERLLRAQIFRGMETEFGIIPYPKWDTNQDKYYTQSQNGYSVAVVPIDVPNPEMTGAVLDVLSALSYENVIPAYYDQALKDKYARDDDSGEMLDIIREGFKVNFGYFYYSSIGMGGIFRELIGQDNTNFVSYYAVNSKGYERNLKKVLKAYETDAE